MAEPPSVFSSLINLENQPIAGATCAIRVPPFLFLELQQASVSLVRATGFTSRWTDLYTWGPSHSRSDHWPAASLRMPKQRKTANVYSYITDE